MSRPLVLCSTSRYRRELLERLRLPFACAAPEIDESPRPQEAVAALVGAIERMTAQVSAAADALKAQ